MLEPASQPSPTAHSRDQPSGPFRAVFFDFGGVVLTSPFEAFERYEREHNIPVGFIRLVNTQNPDGNAWARLERGEIAVDDFAGLFEKESAAAGHRIDGRDVLAMLAGDVRPAMVEAVRRLGRAGFVTACLTNNVPGGVGPPSGERAETVKEVLSLFDHLVESSVIGVRKPEPEFYRRAIDLAGVEPARVVFLDDLGINLKPARAMGMTTIKVVDPGSALAELEHLVGLTLVDR